MSRLYAMFLYHSQGTDVFLSLFPDEFDSPVLFCHPRTDLISFLVIAFLHENAKAVERESSLSFVGRSPSKRFDWRGENKKKELRFLGGSLLRSSLRQITQKESVQTLEDFFLGRESKLSFFSMAQG